MKQIHQIVGKITLEGLCLFFGCFLNGSLYHLLRESINSCLHQKGVAQVLDLYSDN